MALSSGFFTSAKLAAGVAVLAFTLATPADARGGGGGHGGFGGGGFHGGGFGGGGFHGGGWGGRGGWAGRPGGWGRPGWNGGWNGGWGGGGVWGPIPMPPNAQVNDKDIKTLVDWVLTQK